MRRLSSCVWLIAVVATGDALPVCGQDYPNKPIRVVTGEPGGGSDFAARVLAQGLTTALGKQVVVDSRAVLVYAALLRELCLAGAISAQRREL